MKRFKSIPISKVKVDGEYYFFDSDTLTLSEVTGQELIDAVCRKYEYAEWLEEELSYKGVKAKVKMKDFLKYAEELDDEEYCHINIFEKKVATRSKK